MGEARTHAHPMVEPLDYSFTPEAAESVLAGDALLVYQLLWKAALATVTEGPAIREDQLVLTLTSPGPEPTTIYLQAPSQQVVDQGWLEILPMEACLADADERSFPQSLQAVSDATAYQLDAKGTRRRGPEACEPLLRHIGAPAMWTCEVVTESPTRLKYDTLIGEMAASGVGRPSTFGGRLQQAVANDLVREEADGLAVGQRGRTLLQALSQLPNGAAITAMYCADLESQLEEVERDSATAGAVLSEFCERVLGQGTQLAAWLDAVEIDGETMDEAMRRASQTLPMAESWEHATVPSGINPRYLAYAPNEAMAARAALDAMLAMADPGRWKSLSPRARAVRRLAMITLFGQRSSLAAWAMLCSRDLVWRWWLDLGPDEAPFREEELRAVEHEVKAVSEKNSADWAELYAQVRKSL